MMMDPKFHQNSFKGLDLYKVQTDSQGGEGGR